jgi:hypothetical protein
MTVQQRGAVTLPASFTIAARPRVTDCTPTSASRSTTLTPSLKVNITGPPRRTYHTLGTAYLLQIRRSGQDLAGTGREGRGGGDSPSGRNRPTATRGRCDDRFIRKSIWNRDMTRGKSSGQFPNSVSSTHRFVSTRVWRSTVVLGSLHEFFMYSLRFCLFHC